MVLKETFVFYNFREGDYFSFSFPAFITLIIQKYPVVFPDFRLR